MSLERVDTRFLLSQPAHSAVTLGGVEDWTEGLDVAGIRPPEPSAAPDLVVADARHAREALRMRPHAIIVEGRTRLRPREWEPTRCIALPDLAKPELVLPLESHASVRHGLASRLAGKGVRASRNRLAAAALSRGLLPPGIASVTILERGRGQPFLVGAARDLGIPEEVSYYLSPGRGGPLSRSVFHLFRRDAAHPDWVLKFNRLPGYEDRFDRDEDGMRAVTEAGERVARHAPRLLGRFEVDGVHASVETAAHGTRLPDVLTWCATRADRLRVVRRVARWVVDTARESALEASAHADTREWLARDVLPRWRQLEGSDVLSRLRDVRATFTHGDLHPWNVFVQGDEFTLIDWEDARPNGFPLWDLVWFLVDALALIDAVAESDEERAAHMVRLCRGELEASTELFGWIEQAIDAAAVPREAVGPLVTLLWVTTAHWAGEHAERVARHTSGSPAPAHPVLFAQRWLADPALGPEWPSWRDRRRAVPSGP